MFPPGRYWHCASEASAGAWLSRGRGGMEADHIGHPDQKDSDVQADPQNERNTAEQARPADPFGQAVSMCERPLGAIRIRAVVRRARALPGADAAAEQ